MKRTYSSTDRDSSTSSSSSTLCFPAKRIAVTAKTVDKWILEHDKTLNTSTWLEYERAERYHVATLRCKVCTQFNSEGQETSTQCTSKAPRT